MSEINSVVFRKRLRAFVLLLFSQRYKTPLVIRNWFQNDAKIREWSRDGDTAVVDHLDSDHDHTKSMEVETVLVIV